MRKPANLRWKLLFLAGFAALVAFWICFEIPCVIRLFTGLICPGCGMTRAWLSALRLDIISALGFHPLFWSVPVFFLYILYDGRLFRNERLNNLILFGLVAALLICYIIRLIVFLDGNLTI